MSHLRVIDRQTGLPLRPIGVPKTGTVALDDTKIHAKASRHSALSYEYAHNIKAQSRAEMTDLFVRAEAADQADVPDDVSAGDTVVINLETSSCE